MQIFTGSYIGNNTDDRNIAGVGFQPDLVIIKGDTTQMAVFATSTMDAGDTAYFANPVANIANAIQSLGADGFQIGTHVTVNVNLVVYYYICIRDNGAGDFHVGTYTGNGDDNRDIAGVGFLPSVLWTKADAAAYGWFKTASMDATASIGFHNQAATTSCIQALGADGFQVGTNAAVNQDTVIYHYVAFKAVAGYVATGTYTGNNTDNRSIAGAGFQPDVVLDKASSYSNARAYVYINTMDAGDSACVDASAPAANYIQAMEADGFQVGTGLEVNADTVVFYWFALKEGNSSSGGIPKHAMYYRRMREAV